MKRKGSRTFLSMVLTVMLIFSNLMLSPNSIVVHAEGDGTWDNPYTVAQAVGIQDNSIKTVQGYIVGQPTAEKTVITSGFPNDYAIAIADKIGETDTTKMLYIQVTQSFRSEFGLKTNPSLMGSIVRVTGNLTPYFKPHSGLLNPSRMEKIDTGYVAVTGVVLDKTEASLMVGGSINLAATVIPENASNKNITWTSNNTTIVAVDKGSVTGVSEGTTVITVTTEDGEKTASCTVTVTPAVDTNAPEITNITPQSGESTGSNLKPVISAQYSDASGIDASSVKLALDGIDITSKAQITETNITYLPENDLSIGEHTAVLEVWDKCQTPNKAMFTWNFWVGEKQYNLYFGQIHSHTNYSDGQGTPDEAFKYAKYNAGADFFAVTDHSNSFDNDTSATLPDGSSSSEWNSLRQLADEYNEAGKFAAIAGYEMTWSGSTGGWGHINTFNTEGFLSRNSKINNRSVDLPAYYNEIKKYPQSISQLNHPGSNFGDFADFGYYDPQVDNVVTLIEVGNGEGPVRGSGYFPSYNLYTRALDKGWHVAPTNNQDNHLGNWVLANTARTVVLASELTREGVYDSLRNMRTYATEDNNLRIMYKVNGNVMGSILSNPSTLNIDITINDPDSTDRIGRVSIISNGGVVAAEKTFDTNIAEWNISLDPQYSYYYVRVDQADKDIAVTAPVWTGEQMLSAGISKVSASQNIYTVNSPVDLTAEVYNNGLTAIPGINVEFFVDTVLLENKIGEAVTDIIQPGGKSTAAINWVPKSPGSYKIYARASINVGGNSKVSLESTTVDVLDGKDVVKVVVDAGHYNQYVNGDYAGKITTFKTMLGEKKFMLYENKDTLTVEDLSDAKILVLTDPQSKDKTTYKLYKSQYTDEEVNTIKDFVNNGGCLIITSRADYDDKGVTDPQYQTANQGNKVLEAIGSNLRFNDDEVIDNTSNGGLNFKLYFDDYTSNKYGLTRNVPSGITYSAYSGCSVILKSSGSDEAVDWLVKGHDTTESLDSDLQNDSTPVEKGNVYSIAAEILPGGGKIIAAGTTFFSDFEIAGDNLYSNKQMTENVLDWFMKPELSEIGDVRADRDGDGKPDLLGKKVMVEGRVTAASKASVKNTAFFDVIYIQDEVGGITVFGVSNISIPLGVKVRVTGVIDQYDGDTEIQVSNENTDVEVIDSNIVLVEPVMMSTGESMVESNEGRLIMIKGIVKSMTENSLFIDDGTGEARVYVNGYIGDGTENPDMLGKWDSSIKLGDIVSAVGLASQDAAGHRLRVRNTGEIVKVSTPVKGITLNKEYLSLRPGSSEKLIASVIPDDATNIKVIWESSDPSVAAVDENGVVTGLKIGIANITAKTEDGSFTAVCAAAVSKTPVSNVRINKDSIKIKLGREEKLTALVAPGNADIKNVIWSCDSDIIRIIEKNEKLVSIEAVSLGKAKVIITSLDGGYTFICEVEVIPE